MSDRFYELAFPEDYVEAGCEWPDELWEQRFTDRFRELADNDQIRDAAEMWPPGRLLVY